MRYAPLLLSTFGCLGQDLTAERGQHEAMPVFGTTVVIPGGLRGQIYHLKRDTDALPDFARLKPKGTIYTN